VSSSRPEQKRPSEPRQGSYQPPSLTVLATVAELTQGVANPSAADIVFSSAVVSDRALKQQLLAVDSRRVLAGLAGLSL
jgi:hypothetical protein